MKLLSFFACLIVAAQAGTYGGQKTSLEDIERDYTSGAKANAKSGSSAVPSPTKFGFVPHRTSSSYTATKPKYQYSQTNYQVKKSAYKPSSSSQYQQPRSTQYVQSIPQVSYQQQYSISPQKYTGSDYSQQYTTTDQSQQYLGQQQAQEYAYVQPETSQQYTVQYQQPTQQYEQYENVQYVTDNSIAQPESKQYYSQQPQYYYVQEPSTAVESVLDPKSVQYVMYVPSYAANSIPADQKYLEQYSSVAAAESQLPPVSTTVAKYTTAIPSPGKSSSAKQYVSSQNIQYIASSKGQYQPQEEVIIKREPKSLLDSYVPSYVQLQYLRQQGKSSGYSKY